MSQRQSSSVRPMHWLALLGAFVGVGVLQVAQHTALYMKAYAVGERADRLHRQESDVAWLNTEVEGLASPLRLARVAQERQLKLVAWSTLSAAATPEPAFTAESAVAGPIARAPDDTSD